MASSVSFCCRDSRSVCSPASQNRPDVLINNAPAGKGLFERAKGYFM